MILLTAPVLLVAESVAHELCLLGCGVIIMLCKFGPVAANLGLWQQPRLPGWVFVCIALIGTERVMQVYLFFLPRGLRT
jgi:hypothetical protein